MYIGLRGHGHQECHLIDPLGLMREDLTDPSSRLTMLLELERAFHERPGHSGEAFGFLGRPKLLTMQTFELGFVVKGVHWTGTPGHEKLDDAPNFCAMMKTAVEFKFTFTQNIPA